jgi:drug/metabolite transporter (DMT)-like permease
LSDYRVYGVVFAALAAMFFSFQDALVKWLSSDFSLFQLLFVRSIIGVTALCALIRVRFGWTGLITRRPGGHLLRALSNLIAFLSYYFAITRMPLADATSLVLGYPLFLALLSGIFLGEHPRGRQVLALIAGFLGVMFVVQPSAENVDWLGAGAAIVGSLMFAVLGLQTRYLSKTESTELMVFSAALSFLVVTGLTLPFVWKSVTVVEFCLMVLMGSSGILGQYCLVSGFRYAPVYLVGALEYTGLIWAILFGWRFFNDIPSLAVLVGAILIITSGIVIVQAEKSRIH